MDPNEKGSVLIEKINRITEKMGKLCYNKATEYTKEGKLELALQFALRGEGFRNADAAYLVVQIYRANKGILKNSKKVYNCLGRAAILGHPVAQREFGLMNLQTLYKHRPCQGMKYLAEAVKNGDTIALYYYGYYLKNKFYDYNGAYETFELYLSQGYTKFIRDIYRELHDMRKLVKDIKGCKKLLLTTNKRIRKMKKN